MKRFGQILGAVLLLVIALVAVRLAPLFLAPNDYAGVPSIERGSTFHNPALLRTAWALPVAARYRRLFYEFQRNQSVCGPTSVADVLHSLGDASSQERVLPAFPGKAGLAICWVA